MKLIKKQNALKIILLKKMEFALKNVKQKFKILKKKSKMIMIIKLLRIKDTLITKGMKMDAALKHV